MSEDYKSLGFIGLGVMGHGMCRNLAIKSGLPVFAYDIDADSLAKSAEWGVRATGSVIELAEQADVIFLSLPSGVQVEKVSRLLLQEPGRVRVVVDMSTAPPSLARELAEAFSGKYISFVDAPVARLRQAAWDGTLSVMAGCSSALFDSLQPLLAHMGSDVTRCGDVGAGQTAKILNNMVVFMNVHALAEALAIGRAHGVDGKVLFDVFSLGSADSFILRNAGMKHLVPDHFPLATFPTDYALKDIGYALQLASEAEISPPGALATQALLNAAKSAGFAKEYYPVFVKMLEGKAPKVRGK